MKIRIIKSCEDASHPTENRLLKIGDEFHVNTPTLEGEIEYIGSDNEDYILFADEWQSMEESIRIRILTGIPVKHPYQNRQLDDDDHIYVDYIDPEGYAHLFDADRHRNTISPDTFEVVQQTKIEILAKGVGGSFHPTTSESVKLGDTFYVDKIDKQGFAHYWPDRIHQQEMRSDWFRVVEEEAKPPCCCNFLILTQLGCQCGGTP
jgi:hypothetical protein